MWSNQLTSKVYFAVHLDGYPDNIWQQEETALPGPKCTGACADDHLNIKALKADSSGRVFAAIKTSLTEFNAPLVMLLVRDPNGIWESHVFGRVRDHHTRPIVLLDEEHGRLYMFASQPEAGGAIHYKTSPIDNIQFSLGLGLPFIDSSTDITINNATSTKQNLSSTTGLLVLASDQNARFYLHNFLELGPGGRPVVAEFSPASGTPGATVTIAGNNFTGASQVAFNGVTTTFTVISDTEIQAAVPGEATTGRTNAAGTAFSASDFSVTTTAPPAITSFSPTSGPVGAAVTLTGSSFTGATRVAFNGRSATFTVVSDTRIDTKVPVGATTGKISVKNAAGTAFSASDFLVTPKITSFSPTSGPPTTLVTIKGSAFTGATEVAFNGTAATFTVVSYSRIDARVPLGPTTGKISVTTPSGTGFSTKDFVVTIAP